MDVFNNCPETKEDKKDSDKVKKEETKPLMVYKQKMTDGYVAHEVKLEKEFDRSYKGSLETIHG